MTQITQTRILWVILVFCVLTPMVFPLGLPLGPSPEGDAAYDFIHGLPAGSIAMMVIEVAPSSAGELWPMALAIGRHHLSLGVLPKVLLSEYRYIWTKLYQPAAATCTLSRAFCMTSACWRAPY